MNDKSWKCLVVASFLSRSGCETWLRMSRMWHSQREVVRTLDNGIAEQPFWGIADQHYYREVANSSLPSDRTMTFPSRTLSRRLRRTITETLIFSNCIADHNELRTIELWSALTPSKSGRNRWMYIRRKQLAKLAVYALSWQGQKAAWQKRVGTVTAALQVSGDMTTSLESWLWQGAFQISN